MSNYQFSPPPNICPGEHNYATWEKGFSPEDIEIIREIGDKLPMAESTIGTEGSVSTQIRKSRTAWVDHNTCPMVYDKMAFIARQLNGQFFDFDLYGFVEDMQYTLYGPDKEHYDWHMDKGVSTTSPRKLSMVLQLSDPSEYEGGDLELMIGNEPMTVKKEQGYVVVFPSFIMHRVTPVTRGTRRSLVVWIAGPRFR